MTYEIMRPTQIETRLVNHLLEIFDECDSDKDNKINYAEWEKLASIMRSKFPLAEKHFTKMCDCCDACWSGDSF